MCDVDTPARAHGIGIGHDAGVRAYPEAITNRLVLVTLSRQPR